MAGKAQLDVLAWNVYVGNKPKNVVAELTDLLAKHNPEAVVLMEAGKMHGHLEGLGYRVRQLKDKRSRPGNLPGDGNIALMVRNDVGLRKSFVMRMKTFWKGPKHGHNQDPRVYRWARIRFGGRVWKLGGAHTPFGKAARLESRRRLVRWAKWTHKGRPTVLVLDANMKLDDFEKVIAKPSGMQAAGHGIDLVGYKNCRLLRSQNLGKNGSDHPAMLYTFEAL